MHPDLSSHLHSDKCNELIQLLKQCHDDHPFRKFIGICNSEDAQMLRCLKEERIARRNLNRQKSDEMKKRWRMNAAKAREKEAQQQL